MNDDVLPAIDDLKGVVEGFKNGVDSKIGALETENQQLKSRVEELEALESVGATPRRRAEPKYHVIHGPQKAFVVPHDGRLSDVPDLQAKADISLERWARALVFGDGCEDKEALQYVAEQKNVTTSSTGVLLPEAFRAQWIDMARAQSVLSRAGMRTVTMPEQTLTWSHQTADPTIAWRSGEGISLSATDPTFATRTLTAKTVAVRTQVSLEATQDIPSFGQQIAGAYTKAFAAAIDQAGIRGTSPAPTGLHTVSGTSKVTSVGTPTNWDEIVDGAAAFLNANNSLDELTGIVMHPNVWKVFAKLKTGISSDNTPLELPPAIEDVPRFVTTNADDSSLSPEDYHVVMGNFADLVMGVRMNPTIRILDATTSMASNLLVEIIGVARIDFLVQRPGSFVILEDVTTS